MFGLAFIWIFLLLGWFFAGGEGVFGVIGYLSVGAVGVLGYFILEGGYYLVAKGGILRYKNFMIGALMALLLDAVFVYALVLYG